MGSHTAQMAKAVCIYSPMQFLFWYDRPVPDSLSTGAEGEIRDVPELGWFDKMPTAWEESKVLEGDMENFATIVRKSGDAWFLGSLNGISPRKATWKCDFLDKGKKYKAIIYTHDSLLNTATKVKMTTRLLDHQSELAFSIGERNGVAIHIFPL